MPRLVGAGFLTVLTVASLLASGSQALANHVQCGDVITRDTTLDSDLIDCPGDGIVIGASDITLDLGGHTVAGGGVGCGVVNGPSEWCAFPPEAYDRVIIRHGTVRGFAVGIGLAFVDDNALERLRVGDSDVRGIWLYAVSGTLVEGNTVSSGIMLMAERNTLRRNRISNSRGHGIHAFDAGNNRIERNIVSHNGGDGVHGFGMGSTLIQRNVIVANGGAGISTDDGSMDNRIEDNRIWDNAGAGVSMYAGAHQNRVAGNSVLRNRSGGVFVGYGDGNEITENRISGNGGTAAIMLGFANVDNSITANRLVGNSGDGIVLTGEGVSDNLIEANRVTRNGGDGIYVKAGFWSETDSSGNVVRRNVAVGNADDGVDSDSRLTTITRNMGMRNGDLGIEAVAGVTDGGSNRAFGNGNPLQCVNVFCR